MFLQKCLHWLSGRIIRKGKVVDKESYELGSEDKNSTLGTEYSTSIYKLEQRILLDATAPTLIATDLADSQDTTEATSSVETVVNPSSDSNNQSNGSTDSSPTDQNVATSDAQNDHADLTLDASNTNPTLIEASEITGTNLNGQISLAGLPEHGNVSIDQSTGLITYTPEIGYKGMDTFLLNIEGPDLLMKPYTVELNVDSFFDINAVNLPDSINTNGNELVFVHGSINDLDILLSDVSPNAEVHILDRASDGIEQILNIIGDRQDIQALHLIGEGTAAQMHLGGSFLTTNSINGQYADQLAELGEHLTENADILIYGSNFGQGEQGEQATNDIAELTGADVASSTDRTGHITEFGNWTLEYEAGTIDTAVVIGINGQTDWVGALATYTVNTTDDNTATDSYTTLREAIISANNTSGVDTIVFNISVDTLLEAERNIQLSSNLPNITDNLIIDGANIDGSNNERYGIVVDGGGAFSAFYIDSSAWFAELTVKNFTIQNTFNPPEATRLGAAIYVAASNGSLAVENMYFLGNKSYIGGAAIFYDSPRSLYINNSTFESNTGSASGRGGAIYSRSAEVVVTNSTFRDNADSTGQNPSSPDYDPTIRAGSNIYTYDSSANVYLSNVTMSNRVGQVNAGVAAIKLISTGGNLFSFNSVYAADNLLESTKVISGFVETAERVEDEPPSLSEYNDVIYTARIAATEYDLHRGNKVTPTFLVDTSLDGVDYAKALPGLDKVPINVGLVLQANLAYDQNGWDRVVLVSPGAVEPTMQAAADENQNILYTPMANTSNTPNTYSLKGGLSDDEKLLNIDRITGVVTLASGNLNFEDKAQYEFTVVAHDGTTTLPELAVVIVVTDVNEAPTDIALDNSTINENTDTTSAVTIGTLTATDADANETATFTLVAAVVDTDNTKFTITGDTLQINAGVTIDYEAQSSYSVLVRVTDVDGNTYDEALTIGVNNLDEAAPVITSAPTGNANEGQDLLYTATATDTDTTTGTITFSLKAGVGDEVDLTIDAVSGAVTLNSGSLDYESKTQYTFIVKADDGVNTAAEKSVTISITDLNDAPTTSVVTLTAISEDSGPRVITQTQLLVNASDADGDKLTAVNLKPTNLGQATLDATNDGNWVYTPALNDDTNVTFIYDINDGSVTTTTGSATLDITPVNDAPTITPVDVSGTIIEEFKVKESGSITFTDPDSTGTPSADKVTKSVTTAPTRTAAQQKAIEDAFTIEPALVNGNSGTINWDYTIDNADLAFLAPGDTVTVVFTITVSDGNGGTDTQDVTIFIKKLGIKVTNTNDLVNGDTRSIDSLISYDGGDGVSLREAIIASNLSPGPDTIAFDLPSRNVINLTSNLPTITDSLTIDGTSDSDYGIVVNGVNRYTAFQGDNSVSLTFKNFTITSTFSDSSSVTYGGAIYSQRELHIENMYFVNNQSYKGGAAILHTSTAPLYINNSTFQGNRGSIDGRGGAIYIRGEVVVTNSTFRDNVDYIHPYTGTAISAASNVYLSNVTISTSVGSVDATTGEAQIKVIHTSGSFYSFSSVYAAPGITSLNGIVDVGGNTAEGNIIYNTKLNLADYGLHDGNRITPNFTPDSTITEIRYSVAENAIISNTPALSANVEAELLANLAYDQNGTDRGNFVTPGAVDLVETNNAPEITITTTNNFTEDAGGLTAGTTVAASFTTADEEGDTLTVDFTSPVTHYTISGNDVVLTQAGIDAINQGLALEEISLAVTDDGTPSESAIATTQPLVTAVNDAPAATDDAVNATEDTVLNSTTSLLDNDTDLDGDNLTAVDGTFATSQGGSIIIAADGSYTYTPAANFNGIDTVDYTVTDGSLTDVGTLTINVTDGNTEPEGTDVIITIVEDTNYTLNAADFGFTDADVGDTLTAVRIDTLPADGVLTLNGVPVEVGQVIAVAEIDAGLLTYTPDADGYGTGYATFTFSVADPANDFDTIPNTFTFDVTNVNDAPVNVSINDSFVITTNATYDLDGISVIDVDNNLDTVSLTLGKGELTVTLNGTAVIVDGANGTKALTISGTQADINASLATLQFYQGNGAFPGTMLTIHSVDALNAETTSTIPIIAEPKPILPKVALKFGKSADGKGLSIAAHVINTDYTLGYKLTDVDTSNINYDSTSSILDGADSLISVFDTLDDAISNFNINDLQLVGEEELSSYLNTIDTIYEVKATIIDSPDSGLVVQFEIYSGSSTSGPDSEPFVFTIHFTDDEAVINVADTSSIGESLTPEQVLQVANATEFDAEMIDALNKLAMSGSFDDVSTYSSEAGHNGLNFKGQLKALG